MAAALNWDSFTCRGCCGEVNRSLLWQAHQAMKKDGIGKLICDIPCIEAIEPESQIAFPKLVANKR